MDMEGVSHTQLTGWRADDTTEVPAVQTSWIVQLPVVLSFILQRSRFEGQSIVKADKRFAFPETMFGDRYLVRSVPP